MMALCSLSCPFESVSASRWSTSSSVGSSGFAVLNLLFLLLSWCWRSIDGSTKEPSSAFLFRSVFDGVFSSSSFLFWIKLMISSSESSSEPSSFSSAKLAASFFLSS